MNSYATPYFSTGAAFPSTYDALMSNKFANNFYNREAAASCPSSSCGAHMGACATNSSFVNNTFPSTWERAAFENRPWFSAANNNFYGTCPSVSCASHMGACATNSYGFPSRWNNWSPLTASRSCPLGYGSRFATGPFASSWSWPSSWSSAAYPWTAGYNSYDSAAPYIRNMYNIGFRPSSAIEIYSLTNPIRVLDREGNRQLWLSFDLKGYKPEEITVTLNKTERAVIVEAAHEAKDGKEHHVIRKFSRKFILPETLAKVDLSKVELKSCLNAEGLLTIEAILPKMTSEEIAKCPTMSKAVYSPYGYNGYYGCPESCNTRPITTKLI